MDNQKPSDPELEIREETPKTPSSEQTVDDGGKILLSLEELIKTNISTSESLKMELKKQREMLSDAISDDSIYSEHAKIAKEAAKVKSATKQQILNQPTNRELSEKVKRMASELKEKENTLSDYLQEYQRMTGVNQIEGLDGETREIVNVFKVIKKRTKK